MNEKMMDEYSEFLKRKIDVVLSENLAIAGTLGLTQVQAHAATTAAITNCLQFLIGFAIKNGWANEEQVRNIFQVAVDTAINAANHGEKDVNTHSN